MTLYIDIILFENIVMNIIILLATGMICKVKINYIRLLIASVIGAFYAIIFYIFHLNNYVNPISKIVVSIGMVYIAFGPIHFKNLCKQLTIFYLTSFCFGGVSYYLLYNLSPHLIKSSHGILVGSYPIKITVIGGILGFFILNISFRMIKNKLTKKDMLYTVEIGYLEKRINVNVILDTGNMLVDPITRIPVMILEAQKLKNMIPYPILKNLLENKFEEIEEPYKTRCCLIPFASIGQKNGMLPGFKPDYIKIHTDGGEELREKVIIGVDPNLIDKNGVYAGLIGLNLFNGQEVNK